MLTAGIVWRQLGMASALAAAAGILVMGFAPLMLVWASRGGLNSPDEDAFAGLDERIMDEFRVDAYTSLLVALAVWGTLLVTDTVLADHEAILVAVPLLGPAIATLLKYRRYVRRACR